MANGRKTGGRKKGSVNKTTTSVKTALIEAFDKMGGIKSFVAWGKENETEFYKLWSKLVPQEIKSSGGIPMYLKVLDLTGEEDVGSSD